MAKGVYRRPHLIFLQS